MWESLVEKVAGYKLIKKRLRHRCFPFLRTPILKNLNQVAVNNNSKYYGNNVFHENKPPARTRAQLEYFSTFVLLYQQTFVVARTNMMFRSPFVFM